MHEQDAVRGVIKDCSRTAPLLNTANLTQDDCPIDEFLLTLSNIYTCGKWVDAWMFVPAPFNNSGYALHRQKVTFFCENPLRYIYPRHLDYIYLRECIGDKHKHKEICINSNKIKRISFFGSKKQWRGNAVKKCPSQDEGFQNIGERQSKPYTWFGKCFITEIML